MGDAGDKEPLDGDAAEKGLCIEILTPPFINGEVAGERLSEFTESGVGSGDNLR